MLLLFIAAPAKFTPLALVLLVLLLLSLLVMLGAELLLPLSHALIMFSIWPRDSYRKVRLYTDSKEKATGVPGYATEENVRTLDTATYRRLWNKSQDM